MLRHNVEQCKSCGATVLVAAQNEEDSGEGVCNHGLTFESFFVTGAFVVVVTVVVDVDVIIVIVAVIAIIVTVVCNDVVVIAVALVVVVIVVAIAAVVFII